MSFGAIWDTIALEQIKFMYIVKCNPVPKVVHQYDARTPDVQNIGKHTDTLYNRSFVIKSYIDSRFG